LQKLFHLQHHLPIFIFQDSQGKILPLEAKRLNRWSRCSIKDTVFLIQELRAIIRKYLEEDLNSGKPSAFSFPGVLDSSFDPLLKINWYVHDST